MRNQLYAVVEAAFIAILALILFAIVFVVAAGCCPTTLAATDLVRVLQTPPPF